MATYQIGDISKKLGLSADTLRYYEKLGLLPNVGRAASGVRLYNDKDISRLQFVRRAQKMNFSLAEIGDLLSMREDPQHAREDVRALTGRKLSEVKAHVEELTILRNELELLLNLCAGNKAGCPIIEGIDQSTTPPAQKKRRRR